MTAAAFAAWAAVLGALGACAGSYLSVVAHRLPRGQGLSEPSRCPRCDHQLRARDNVPVLGWVLLRGRCRHCTSPIPKRYPALELGVGISWAAAGLATGINPAVTAPVLILIWAITLLAHTGIRTSSVPQLPIAGLPVAGLTLIAAAITSAATHDWASWALYTAAATACLGAAVRAGRTHSA